MKKLKYMLWLVVIGLVALVVYQNGEFFTVKRSIGINLYFFEYHSPELPTGIYYLAVFLIGFLVSYFFTLPHKFRSRRTIRQLNKKIAADEKKIADLEAGLKPASGAHQSPGPAKKEGQEYKQQPAQEVQDVEAVEQQDKTGDRKSGE